MVRSLFSQVLTFKTDFNFVYAETTARTLAITLALLAVYKGEQQKAYEEVQRVLSGGNDLVSRIVTCAGSL